MSARLRILLLLLPAILAGTLHTRAEEPFVDEEEETLAADSTRSRNVIDRIIGYFQESNKPKDPGKFDFSVIGGPHFSSDTKFGIGLVAAGLYHTSRADSLMMPSNVSLYGDVSSAGFYMLGVRGTNIFPSDRLRLTYNLYFSSFLTKFWGVGYYTNKIDGNSTKYNDFSAQLRTTLLVNLGAQVFIGPQVGISYSHATKVKNPELWLDQRLRVTSPTLGLRLEYDTRDNLQAPYRGWYLWIDQSFYPAFLGNKYPFSATEVALSQYLPLWRGSILAWRVHGRWAYGNVPWCLMSKLGDNAAMRGYYPGRYRDKVEADVTVELRQHIWRRSGIALWVGAGTVASRPATLRWRKTLPNVGIGYRWEFKERTNVRLDFGIGRGETGFIFNINEAF